MNSTPLELHEVAALAALVKPGGRSGRNWSSKLRLIIALATYDDGDWCNGPDGELWTGMSPGNCRRLLEELARQRVIVREGTKVFWCEVNPDWRRWDVDWQVPPREIEARMARHRERWVRHPLERLFARTSGARFHRIIALVGVRDNERQKRGSRHLFALPGRAQRILDRAGLVRDSESAIATPGRAQTGGSPLGGVPTGGGDDELSSSDGFAEEVEEGKSDPQWQRVRHAYIARIPQPTLYGRPEAMLAALVARHGAELVLEAIAGAPDGVEVRSLGYHLLDRFASDQLVPTDPKPAATAAPVPVGPVPPPTVEELGIRETTAEERAAALEGLRRVKAERCQNGDDHHQEATTA